jgi:hypothetical protein
MLGSSWVVAQLAASEEGIISMKLVTLSQSPTVWLCSPFWYRYTSDILIICELFNDALISSGHKVPYVRLINELTWMWKEVFVAWFEAVSKYWLRETEGNTLQVISRGTTDSAMMFHYLCSYWAIETSVLSSDKRKKVRPLSWIKHHAMKACGSGGVAPCILKLSARWRWVVSFTPLPLYAAERTPVPIG